MEKPLSCPTDSSPHFCPRKHCPSPAKNFNLPSVCLLPLLCCCSYCLEKKSQGLSALPTKTSVNFPPENISQTASDLLMTRMKLCNLKNVTFTFQDAWLIRIAITTLYYCICMTIYSQQVHV